MMKQQLQCYTPPNMRILIVEDEIKLQQNLKKIFTSEKWAVDTASDGEVGLELALVESYDCIILDIGVPKFSGIEICQQLRSESISTPILMLTARDTLEDKIMGLDSGADDYLIKPFSIDELLARVRALIRRQSNQTSPILSVADLSLDPVSHQVKRHDTTIQLSAKEHALLEYLMRHQNQIISKQILLEHVWGSHVDPFSKVIDVYIGYLRNKIDRAFPDQPPLIKTVRGMGYQITSS